MLLAVENVTFIFTDIQQDPLGPLFFAIGVDNIYLFLYLSIFFVKSYKDVLFKTMSNIGVTAILAPCFFYE